MEINLKFTNEEYDTIKKSKSKKSNDILIKKLFKLFNACQARRLMSNGVMINLLSEVTFYNYKPNRICARCEAECPTGENLCYSCAVDARNGR